MELVQVPTGLSEIRIRPTELNGVTPDLHWIVWEENQMDKLKLQEAKDLVKVTQKRLDT